MKQFEYVEDVEEWLAPLSYEELWEALDPYGIETEEARANCDAQIKSGAVKEAIILDSLKAFARIDLTRQFKLKRRPTMLAYGSIH